MRCFTLSFILDLSNLIIAGIAVDLLRRARRHIGWILIAKVGLIALLYAPFFAPGSRPDIDVDAMGRRIQAPSR